MLNNYVFYYSTLKNERNLSLKIVLSKPQLYTLGMMNLKQARQVLPNAFIERLETEYGLHVSEAILKGFASEKLPAIRINTLKTDIQEIMRIFRELNVRFERIKFLPDSLIILNKDERFFENLEIYKTGKIYFQGISSQLPVLFLNPQPGERVLDMCAAPGSKTTQAGIQMKNQGEIVANEKDQVRFARLKYNLEKQGIKIAKMILGDACRLGEEYNEYFDKVLLDVPCSAEGRIFSEDRRSFSFWSGKNINEHAKLQRRLMRSAVRCLKPGGILIYSTCTLAKEENEDVVKKALEEFVGSLSLVPIDLPDFKYKLPILGGLKGALKAMPSNISEGFFVAKMRKI